jgi:hypothetical protein
MQQLIVEYFWHLVFLLAIAWYFGFVSGKWWEQVKNEPMPDNDEELW